MVIGIESVPALGNLEKILDVPGVDALFVGPAGLHPRLNGGRAIAIVRPARRRPRRTVSKR
jgi:2-keto-3-deoxy-L-rhamnonate aldolase RhmA